MADNPSEKKYCYQYPRPALGMDSLILKRKEGKLWILTIARGKEPFKGVRALPGGFFDMEDDSVERTAARELKEEVGLEVALTLHNVYSAPDRDPRERTVSIAFWGVTKDTDEPTAGDDAEDAQWLDVDRLPKMAFDHNRIIGDLVKWIRERPEAFPLLQV